MAWESLGEWKNFAGMAFVCVPPGTFLLGSPAGEVGRWDDEIQHQVTIARAFWLGKYPVTQRDWQSVRGNNPSYFSCFEDSEKRPVECVTWWDCQQFLTNLNRLDTANQYRLPTEAEWEYACRAGTSSPRYWKLDEVAWYGDNSEDQTQPVGRKLSNQWGLHDMLGNVLEWCSGSLKSDPEVVLRVGQQPAMSWSYQPVRGGSWRSYARFVRSACRLSYDPDVKVDYLGLRCLRLEK